MNNLKKDKPKTAKEVTEQIIQEWKDKHKKGVWKIAVNSDEVSGTEDITDDQGRKSVVNVYEQKTGYFRKPNRMELASTMATRNDPLGIGEELLRYCWLGGDEELLEDDDYFQGALLQFQTLLEVRTGEVKKL